ncbi:DUF4032 domain-containing protein [Nocardioides sp. ChNu-99]|uniref:DUF4032 domain-containing protein n=1 Tax=Nocardioides sp. ChNu-99 TaxID=2839897 RepID=UPI002404BD6B|nr:DUF4032 domain-containing protein [Nocardioides sp. ChNu-99]MDF9717393.1 DUF4032 domain-containing protein [Nocardioides sp. ChNu-99]
MALRIVANRPDPALVTLPWSTPLEEWTEHVVPLPRGLSRHVVRIVQLPGRGGRPPATYAVKETQEPLAFREHRLLRDLRRAGLPSVTPEAVVTGRTAADGEPLPAALLTRHLRFSLPYRSLFSHGASTDDVPSLVDALVVLLVRLHLQEFYWGDVSLSNVLFRRDAGGFAAYLVDAETGEWRSPLSPRLREYDVEVGCQNVFAELMDLQAAGSLSADFEPRSVVTMLQERYDALWNELTGEEEFGTDEMWRIEQRVERLNALGFDVEELDIVTDYDGDRVRIQPRVVEAGHHRRELQALTGLSVEDAQARRLLNDIAAFTAHFGLGGTDRSLVAHKWLNDVYEPLVAMIPPDVRGRLEPAEVFHEVLEHRWYLSEQAGHEVDIFATARDYIDTVLTGRPEEAVAATETGSSEAVGAP